MILSYSVLTVIIGVYLSHHAIVQINTSFWDDYYLYFYFSNN